MSWQRKSHELLVEALRQATPGCRFKIGARYKFTADLLSRIPGISSPELTWAIISVNVSGEQPKYALRSSFSSKLTIHISESDLDRHGLTQP